MVITALLILLSLSSLTVASAPSGPWDTFNYAPASKLVRPVIVKQIQGTVKNAEELFTADGQATLSGNGSYVTLDFGKEVCIFKLYSSISVNSIVTIRSEDLYLSALCSHRLRQA
jgi:hypothetical protein